VWTFQIRENVKFHDGSPLDGAAVVSTFERMRDPAHPHHFDDGQWSNWQGNFARVIEKVELGGHPMEVVFRCKEPAPPFFLQLLGMFTCSIISPKALDEHGADIRIRPVGTGPFKFVKWDTGNEIHLTRNDDYWDGAPKLKDVYLRVSQDATVRADRLIAGSGADLIDNLGPDTIKQLEDAPGVTVARRPLTSFCYLAMNTQKPPFDNPKVREAVAYAIAKENLIRLAYRGYAEPAHVPTLPGFIGYHAGLKDRVRDVEKAKALLREAGYDVK
jgi:peptide/nickel transport system substrate-binding protein